METLETLETPNTGLRPFTSEDWQDVTELANNWKQAPGPSFDRWPTGGEGGKGMTDLFMRNPDKYLAMVVKQTGKVVGLIAINGYEDEGEMDLGHVIHSDYQDNQLDLESLTAVVAHLFNQPDLKSIITKNADHPPQLAPLKALGFIELDENNPGILGLSKAEWTKGRSA